MLSRLTASCFLLAICSCSAFRSSFFELSLRFASINSAWNSSFASSTCIELALELMTYGKRTCSTSTSRKSRYRIWFNLAMIACVYRGVLHKGFPARFRILSFSNWCRASSYLLVSYVLTNHTGSKRIIITSFKLSILLFPIDRTFNSVSWLTFSILDIWLLKSVRSCNCTSLSRPSIFLIWLKDRSDCILVCS